MLTDTVVSHFGKKSRVAEVLKPHWSTAAVYLWQKVVPLAAARKLSEISGGQLEVIESLYDSKGNIIYSPAMRAANRRKRRKRRAA